MEKGKFKEETQCEWSAVKLAMTIANHHLRFES